MHVLRPKNTESGEQEVKNIGDKSQDNNELILQNVFRNERVNQNIDMIQEF